VDAALVCFAVETDDRLENFEFHDLAYRLRRVAAPVDESPAQPVSVTA
jgi:hypothetical protein